MATDIIIKTKKFTEKTKDFKVFEIALEMILFCFKK